MVALLDRDQLERRVASPDASRRRGDLRGVWGPCVTTLILVIVVAAAGIRGADYPAHHFRALLWRESGFSVWNFHWYGGHSTATYGMLSPPFVALIGPFAVVALAALVSTLCFSGLTRALLPGRTTAIANHVFALVVTTNVVVGRVAFGLGLAIALVALIAWALRCTVATVVTSILATLASPVAGVFLALAAGSVAATLLRDKRQFSRSGLIGIAVAVASLSPIVVTSALFEPAGRFPFRGGHLVVSIIVLAVVARVSWSPTIRFAAAIAAAVSVAVFLFPNPLGGNFIRLAQIVAIPILVVGFDRRDRVTPRSAWLLIVPAIGWSLSPGIVAALDSTHDVSSAPEYHRPLIDELMARNADGRPIGRVEIPFTVNHWESFYVAAAVPYIRGWERQTDLDRNSVLYDAALDTDAYRRWLLDNAVRWLAVPDAPIDDDGGGRWEHALVSPTVNSVPWLDLVWSNRHWRLYEIDGYVPIVDRPAELLSQDADRIVIRVHRTASVRIRYAYTDRLSISGGARATASTDGRILAHLPGPGIYTLTVGWAGEHHGDD